MADETALPKLLLMAGKSRQRLPYEAELALSLTSPDAETAISNCGDRVAAKSRCGLTPGNECRSGL
jgi:hypothetical protein